MQSDITYALNEMNENLKRIANQLKEIKQEQKKLNKKLSGKRETTDREAIKQYLPPRFIEELEDQMEGYKSKTEVGWTTSMPLPADKLQSFLEEWEGESTENLGEFRDKLIDLVETIAINPDSAKELIHEKVN